MLVQVSGAKDVAKDTTSSGHCTVSLDFKNAIAGNDRLDQDFDSVSMSKLSQGTEILRVLQVTRSD